MFNARDRHNFSPGLSSWSARDEPPQVHSRGGYLNFANMSVAQFEEFKRRQMFRECYEEADGFQQGRGRAQSQGPSSAPFRPLSQIMREDLEDHGYATDHQPRSRSSTRGRSGWRDEFDDVGYATDTLSRRVPHSRSSLTEPPPRTQRDARSSQDTSKTSSQDDDSEASPKATRASKATPRKKASPSATKAKGKGSRKRRAKPPISQTDTQAPQLSEALRMQAQKLKKKHDARKSQHETSDGAIDGALRHSVTQRSSPPYATSENRRSGSSYPDDPGSGSDRDLHQTSSSHFGVRKELGGFGPLGHRDTRSPSLGPQLVSKNSVRSGAPVTSTRLLSPDHQHHIGPSQSLSASPESSAVDEEHQSNPTTQDAYKAPRTPPKIAHQGVLRALLTKDSTVDAKDTNTGAKSTDMVKESQGELRDRLHAARLQAEWNGIDYEKEREQKRQQAEELRRRDREDPERRAAERRAEKRKRRAENDELERKRAEREAEKEREARIVMQEFLAEQARAQEDERRAEKERKRRKDQARQAFTKATQARRNSGFEVRRPQHVSPPPRTSFVHQNEPIPISSDESGSDDETEGTLTGDTRLEDGAHSSLSQDTTSTDVQMVDVNVPKGILKRPREGLTEPTPLPRKKVRIATPDRRHSPIAASQVQVAAPSTSKSRPQLGGTLRLNSNGTGVAGTAQISETSGVFSRSNLGERLVNNLFDKGALRPKAFSTSKLSQKQETIRNTLIVESQGQQASGEANNDSEDEEIKAARAKINEAKAKKRWEKKAAEKRAKGEDPGIFVYKPSKRSKKGLKDHDAVGDTAQPSNKEKTPKKAKPKKSAIMQKIKKGVHQAAIDRSALYGHAQSFDSSESSDSEVASDSESNIETTEQNISQQTPVNINLHTDAEILKDVQKGGNDEESLFVKDEPDPGPSYHNPDQHTQVAPADPKPTRASTPKLVNDNDDFVDMQDFYAAGFGVDGSLPAGSAHEAMPAEAVTDEFDDLFNDPEPVTTIKDVSHSTLEPVRKRPGVNKKPAHAGNHVRAPDPAAPTHMVNMASHIDAPSRAQDALPATSSKPKSTAASSQKLGQSVVSPTTAPRSQSITRHPESRGFLAQFDFQQPTISRQKPPAPDVIDFDKPDAEPLGVTAPLVSPKPMSRVPAVAQKLLNRLNPSSESSVIEPTQDEPTKSPTLEQPQSSSDASLDHRRSDREASANDDLRGQRHRNLDASSSPVSSPSLSFSHDDSPAPTARAKKPSKFTNNRDGKPLPSLGRFKTNSLKHWAWVEAKTFLETGRAAPGDLNFLRKHRDALDNLLEQKQNDADEKNASKIEAASREIALMKTRPREKSMEEVVRSFSGAREEDSATSTSTSSAFEDHLDSPSTIRSFMSQDSSSATSVDGGYVLPDGRPHTAGTHPRFAGKQLNHPEVRKYFNVQEHYGTDVTGIESNATAGETAGPCEHALSHDMCADEPCYVYLVNRKQWRADENEEEAQWRLGSKPIHYTKDAANTAAEAEKSVLRGGMADNPLERVFAASETNNGLSRWYCKLRTGFIRIEVEQRMLETGDKLMPSTRRGFLPSRVWLIKREIFVRQPRHPRQPHSNTEPWVRSCAREQESAIELDGDEEEANRDDELARQLAQAMMDESEENGLAQEPTRADICVDGLDSHTDRHANDDDQYELISEGLETYDGTHTELWRANRDACDWILEAIFDKSQSRRMDYVFKSNTISDLRKQANSREEGLNVEEQFSVKQNGVEINKMVRVWVEAMRVLGPKNA